MTKKQNRNKHIALWKIRLPVDLNEFPKNSDGQIVYPHIIKAIEQLNLKYDFRFNVVLDVAEYKSIKSNIWEDVSDRLIASLHIEFTAKGISISKDMLRSIAVSNYLPTYNPFNHYFNSLPVADGHDYIKDLADTIQTDDDKLWYIFLKKWLVNMVRCSYYVDETNQWILTFFGGQGIGKTKWVMRLLPPALKGYLFTGYSDIKHKDFQVRLSRYLLIFLDEIDSYKGDRQGIIKSLATQEEIKSRKHYGLYDSSYARYASLIAAVNHLSFLSDISGNRRFLVIETLSIDYRHTIDMDKVFAQVFALATDKDFIAYFGGDDNNLIEERNKMFREKSPEEEMILEMYEPCETGAEGSRLLMPSKAAEEINRRYSDHKISITGSKVGTLMKSMGFKQSSEGTGNERRNVYSVQDKSPIV
ncbi:hypothetical protein CAP36_07870 [Chitinophagaceae bacterium IBVUCB2]|nr:hypothetical protein CAP36_07870 [Chitinophagaceae bacterium IBVUCB2]